MTEGSTALAGAFVAETASRTRQTLGQIGLKAEAQQGADIAAMLETAAQSAKAPGIGGVLDVTV